MAAAEALYAHEHATMPGVLAHTISQDPKDPDLMHTFGIWANVGAFKMWFKAYGGGELGKACMQYYDRSKAPHGKMFCKEHEQMKEFMTNISAVGFANIKFLDLAGVGMIDLNRGAPQKIKVEYFGMGYGRADCIRMLLHHAKIDYEYVGYDFEQWGQIKGSG